MVRRRALARFLQSPLQQVRHLKIPRPASEVCPVQLLALGFQDPQASSGRAERAVDLGGEVFSKPDPEETPADLVLACVGVAGPDAGEHECPGGGVGIADQLHLLPRRHPPVSG